MVVVDANILLALYEVGADAREEVLAILEGVASRLWVPHQVVIEYSRNRRRVVEARVHNFTDTRRSVKAAEVAAVKAFTGAIAKVEKLRTRNRTTREWSLVDHSLDESSLKQRLDGVVDAILAEVDLLNAEHDLMPGDVVADDPVYDRVDRLLSDRIGQPVGEDNLRRLVELAITFRFPNDIPPGHADGSKSTSLLKAGDYLLWWQLLEHAKSATNYREVLLVTAETKPDWWNMQEGKVRGPRAELVQEMSDATGKSLVLVTLAEFLEGASRFLRTTVSEDTLQQVLEAQEEANQSALWLATLQESGQVDIYELPPWRLVELALHLFAAMGYTIRDAGSHPRSGFDLLISDSSASTTKPIGVEVKQHRYRTPSATMHHLHTALASAGLDKGILVTTGKLSPEASEASTTSSIQVIDSSELARLLGIHLGISAKFGRREGTS